MNLRELRELVVKHARILTSNRFVWKSEELPRWRLIRRNDLKSIWSIFR
jgi:hypothetical protein